MSVIGIDPALDRATSEPTPFRIYRLKREAGDFVVRRFDGFYADRRPNGGAGHALAARGKIIARCTEYRVARGVIIADGDRGPADSWVIDYEWPRR